jgi:hypothetical protein
MKNWLVFILLLITTACTFIPCCGFDQCCADQVANTANHDRHQTESACSPFFACVTCPGFVQLTKQIQLCNPIVEKRVYPQTLLKIDLPTYSRFFWQPPRSC